MYNVILFPCGRGWTVPPFLLSFNNNQYSQQKAA